VNTRAIMGGNMRATMPGKHTGDYAW
jgi:hypothetical protein